MPRYTLVAGLSVALVATPATRGDEPAAKHWAFRAPSRPPVPAANNPPPAARNPIDNFILARLAKEGLKPSPEADKVTLCRRLYLDLVGLPPTPKEVDAFVSDTAAD